MPGACRTEVRPTVQSPNDSHILHRTKKGSPASGDPFEVLGVGPVRGRKIDGPNQGCLISWIAYETSASLTVLTPFSNIALDTGPPPFITLPINWRLA